MSHPDSLPPATDEHPVPRDGTLTARSYLLRLGMVASLFWFSCGGDPQLLLQHGLYLDGKRIVEQGVSSSYTTPIVLAAGTHTLSIVGDADYTVSGQISGPGSLTIVAGEGNTIVMKGEQTHAGSEVQSGTVDYLALGKSYGDIKRTNSGIVLRMASPMEITQNKLLAWFDATDPTTVFSDVARKVPQTKVGGPVRAWTNKAKPIHASMSTGQPALGSDGISLQLSNSSMVVPKLGVANEVSVLAILKTKSVNGSSPAVFATNTGNVLAENALLLGGDLPVLAADAPPPTKPPNIAMSMAMYRGAAWEKTWGVAINTATFTMFGRVILLSGSVSLDGISAEINGRRAGPTAFATKQPWSDAASSGYYIGRNSIDSSYWNGDYYEILVTPGVQDLDALTGYLAWHLKSTALLPDSHPYKALPVYVRWDKEGTHVVTPTVSSLSTQPQVSEFLASPRDWVGDDEP